MSRTLRSALALASIVLAGGAVSALGCTSVLGLDDLSSGTRALCDTVGRCSARLDADACDAHVTAGVESLAKTRQTKWIEDLGAKRCADSCNAARRCLDRSPICFPRGHACDAREECCGFGQGTADCDARSGHCCARKGVRCTSDADCCAGAGACEPTTGTCGGVVCSQPGAACASGFECCSGVCDAASSTCSAEACFGDGFDCAADAECCSKSCDPSSGKCITPACGVIGDACDPKAASPCCVGLQCFDASKIPGEPGVCSTAQCFPEQYDCSTGAQCCPVPGSGDETGYCHPQYHLCTTRACVKTGGACKTTVDCCSGSCFEGTCQECSATVCDPDSAAPTDQCCRPSNGNPVTCDKPKPGIPGLCRELCDAGCDHDVCTPGTALKYGGCGADAACTAKVCADDSYCCCVAWDDICVGKAAAMCETSCGF